MIAGPNCYALIRHYESCRLRSYPDPKTNGAPYTIGWGACGAEIGPGVVWTQDRADARLSGDVAMRECDANNAIRVVVTQGIYDAFVSALYNIGHGSPARDGIVRLRSGYPSTCLAKLNACDFDAARESLGRWVSPGSSVEHGLRRRRTAEQHVWDGMDAAEAIALGELA